MIPVHGPLDLQIGDLVEIEVGNAHTSGKMRGEVTSVGADSASLCVNGKERVVKYKKPTPGKWVDKVTRWLMLKVEPIDLWRERRPPTPFVRNDEGGFWIASKALHDNTSGVIKDLQALAAWLRGKPPSKP